MEITQKLNIPKKEVGDKFYAEEVNQIVNAINDNSTKIDNNANQITELKNQQFANIDNITAKRINVDENLYVNKYLSNQAGDTFALKGNNIVGADYTLITDQDLGDYVTKTDTKQIIKAQSLEVNDGIKFYTNRDAMSMTVSKLYGDFDDNQMPFLDFLGENGQPRLTNIADPLNATDAATKGYVDQRAVTDWKYETTIEWDGTNTIKDYSYNFPKSVKEVFIVGLTTYNSGNKGAIDIWYSLSNQSASNPTRRVYWVSTTMSTQFVHIHKLGGEYYADVYNTNNPLVASNLQRSQGTSDNKPTTINYNIRSIKIKITTDLVRPTGAGQKWYIYSK